MPHAIAMNPHRSTLSMPDHDAVTAISDALYARFGERLSVDEQTAGLPELAAMASRRVHRRYLDKPIDTGLLRLLCACALSAPSKSDLQQADILIVQDAEKRRILADLLPDQLWMRTAPAFLIFLANGRRLPEIARLRGKPFPNDHLDQFFNASVDAGSCSPVLCAPPMQRASAAARSASYATMHNVSVNYWRCRSGSFPWPACA